MTRKKVEPKVKIPKGLPDMRIGRKLTMQSADPQSMDKGLRWRVLILERKENRLW